MTIAALESGNCREADGHVVRPSGRAVLAAGGERQEADDRPAPAGPSQCAAIAGIPGATLAGRNLLCSRPVVRRRRLPARPGFTDRWLAVAVRDSDLGVHLLDLAWWMIGCPRPTSVTGVTHNHLGRRGDLGSEWGEWDAARIDVEDFAAGLVRLEGAALSLEVSWLAFQPEKEFWRLQMYGSAAGISWPEGLIVGEDQRIPWDTRLAEATGEKWRITRSSVNSPARCLTDHRHRCHRRSRPTSSPCSTGFTPRPPAAKRNTSIRLSCKVGMWDEKK